MKFKDTLENGQEIEIYSTEGKPPYTILGARKTNLGWEPMNWTKDGRYNEQHDYTIFDLIPIVEYEYQWLYFGHDKFWGLTKEYNTEEEMEDIVGYERFDRSKRIRK
jgi:hypothetical protein